MPVTLRNVVDLPCEPAVAYAYLTQPWCWHEWHPSSRSATRPRDELAVGDRFDEAILVQPLPFVSLRREVRYTVLAAEPPSAWAARGETGDGWLELRYRFEACGGGTRFERTLEFDMTGPVRLLLGRLRRRQEQVSTLAMARLQRRLTESAQQAQSGEKGRVRTDDVIN